MRSLYLVAGLVAVVVAVAGCQVGLSRPGFEFRVFRAPVCLEPHLVGLPSGEARGIPLQPPGLRSFEPFIGEEVRTAPTAPPTRWRPAPLAAPVPPCMVEELVRVLRRVDQRLGPEKLGAPRVSECPAP